MKGVHPDVLGKPYGQLGIVLMTAGGLLFWGLIIAGVVLLVRSTGRSGQPGAVTAPTPQQALADRFAHGRIDADDYNHRLHVLGRAASARQPGG